MVHACGKPYCTWALGPFQQRESALGGEWRGKTMAGKSPQCLDMTVESYGGENHFKTTVLNKKNNYKKC